MAFAQRTVGRRLRRLLLGASILGGAGPFAVQAQTTLPSGGSVVAGQAAIAQAGGAMTIRQSSDRAIIDWAGFSIGEKASVLIENGSGATLNRVTGGAVSSIDGLLRASGSVYLVNPNGVVIGARGVVETGGSFIASTLDVPNAAFLSGGSLVFAGTSRATVVNLGKVGALGGNVALIGAVVENRGSLSAANGTVGMIAGSKVLLRDAAHDGGGLFSVLYGDARSSAANGGTIDAANVELRAQQGNVYALAGNSVGTVNATGVRRDDGKVWLVSDAGGTEVAGTIRARGAGGSAGAIETSGARLHIGAATIDAGGGTWLVDPEDLIVDAAAAATINASLGNNTGVTLTTGANGASAYGNGDANGAGDILINAGLAWNTGATLTLNAYHGIAVNADIAVNGGGSVVLRTNQGGTGGEVRFNAGHALSFADGQSGQTLSINDTAYTLLRSWDDVKAISGTSSNYALAHGLGDFNSTSAAVALLSGALDGLGNKIESATIQPTNASNVGLIGTISGSGAVRNLVFGKISIYDWSSKGSSVMGGLAGVNNGSIANIVGISTVATGNGSDIGGLVGINSGDIRNISFAGDPIGNNNVGGLVGTNYGRISNAHNSATSEVWGAYYVGGLVGRNGGVITDSSADAPVIANEYYIAPRYNFLSTPLAGGLVGSNEGTITRSFATGAVKGSRQIGGLVGQNKGTITRSFATGAASAWSEVGGLVGENQGLIDIAYATGAVTASGSSAGGLVGTNLMDGMGSLTIRNAYATGNVTGDDIVGGLVGASADRIETSYATGKVVAKPGNRAGGIAGSSSGDLVDVYWSVSGTGRSSANGDSSAFDPQAHGLYDYNLMRALSYEHWDIDASGGQDKVWRIYEGSTTPLLKAFLKPATVSFTGAATASVLYDGTNQSGRLPATVRAANGQPIDTAQILGTAAYACSGGDASCTNAGSYQVRASGGLYSTQTGYDLLFSNDPANLTITPRTLTVAANDRTMAYGDSLPILSYRVGGDGLVGTDTLSGALATSAGSTSGVGSYAIGQGTLGAGSNYALSFTGGTLSVTPRALTVTANDRSMMYGDSVPALTYSIGGAGLVNGDTLSGALATGASATSNVGSYAIGQGTLAASANYALSFVGGSLSVLPRALTVTANDRTMVYGDGVPALTYVLGGAGLANGDMLTGTLTTGASETSNVGSYAIGQGTLSAGGNYALHFVAGNLSVTPRQLSLTADDQTMVYGGSVPTLTYALSGGSLVNGDALSGALGTSASATSGVGSYAIGLGSLSAGGNYALSLAGGHVSVTPRPLAVAAADRTMAYGDAVPALTYAVTGGSLVNGDTLSGVLATSGGTTSPVGSYAIGQGSLGAGANYALSFTGGTLSITPRALMVTADDRTMIYGDGVPALTYAVTGGSLVNGDTLRGALATSAGPTSPVGSYAIGQGTLGAGANYALRFTGATLAVTPRPLTVTADDRSMVYGDALPVLSYTLGGAGLVNGDTLSGALGTGASAASPVGNYAIGQGTLSADSNYALTFTGGAMTVTPRSLTVTANNRTMAYGDDVPALTYSVGGAGLVNGDTLSGALTTAATSSSNVGGYAIDQGTLAASTNYLLRFAGGNLSVTPRLLEVRADARTMVYGDAVPGLTYTVGGDGLVHGDTLRGALATAVRADSGVGRYAIEQGTLQAGSNYALRFVGADVSVTPRPLGVTAGDVAMVYGDAVPVLTYAVDRGGLVNGDTLDGLLRGALGTDASAASSVGRYAIGLGTLSAGPNYALRFGGASLTIMPRPLTVTANDQTMLYGDKVPVLGYTLAGQGLVNGDTLRGALDTTASAVSPVGKYAIGQGTLSAGGNYALTFSGATLAVTPRPLIIQAQDSSKVLGTPLDGGSAGFQAIGLVNGDRVDGVALSSEGFAAEAPYQPNPYAIAASNATGTGLSNYVIIYQNAPTGLTVRDPDVRPTPLSIRLAGDAPPAGSRAARDDQAGPARTDGPVPMRPWPGIFFKRQN